MGNFAILLKKNLLEMVRNKRIIVFSVVFAAISVISALSARFLPEIFAFLAQSLEEAGMGEIFVEKATVADSYVQYISNMGEIAVLLVGVMFATTIIKEKDSGTYSTLKMSKVKDKDILLSHLVAQFILISVAYILSVATFTLLNILLFRQVMGLRGIVVLGYIYLLLLFMIIFSMFASCLCKKKGKAYLLVILGYFALTFLVAFPRIGKFNPFYLLTNGMELMYYEDYILKDQLITLFVTLGICFVLVLVSLFIIRNKINNRKDTVNEDNTERV